MGDLGAIHVSTAWFPLTKLMQLLLLPNVQFVRNREQCLIWPYPLRSPTGHLVANWLHCYKGQQFILTWKNNIPGFAFPAFRASDGTTICIWGLRASTDGFHITSCHIKGSTLCHWRCTRGHMAMVYPYLSHIVPPRRCLSAGVMEWPLEGKAEAPA